MSKSRLLRKSVEDMIDFIMAELRPVARELWCSSEFKSREFFVDFESFELFLMVFYFLVTPRRYIVYDYIFCRVQNGDKYGLLCLLRKIVVKACEEFNTISKNKRLDIFLLN